MVSEWAVMMALCAAPDAGPTPRKIIGEYFGTPITEPTSPWTRELPTGSGSVSTSRVGQSASNGKLEFTADTVSVEGVARLALGKVKTSPPRVRVTFQVTKGTVRVFLRYVGEIFVWCEAAASGTCSLEGTPLQGGDRRPELVLESTAGAEFKGLAVTSP